ncbi:hypothetical protein AB4144_09460, partial [Rhizobiaceae sp. 2RAB30]
IPAFLTLLPACIDRFHITLDQKASFATGSLRNEKNVQYHVVISNLGCPSCGDFNLFLEKHQNIRPFG